MLTLPPRPGKAPVKRPSMIQDPTSKLDMSADEVQMDIKETLNKESTFPEEIPVREEVGKQIFIVPPLC
jgi:hypothetical protein